VENLRGIGNFLRHEYDRIEPDIVWQIASEGLVPLRTAVETMLSEMGRRE
jgi:uncharacterized protein with HEPN domain